MSDEDDRVALFREKEEERLAEWMIHDRYNARQLAQWSRYCLWGIGTPIGTDQTGYQIRIQACLNYMMRQLSRGRVPRMELVNAILTGTADVPSCGYIGCSWAEDHVH